MRLLVSLFTIIDEYKFYEILNGFHGKIEQGIEAKKTKHHKVISSLIQQKTLEYLHKNNKYLNEPEDFDISISTMISILTLNFLYIFENIELMKKYNIHEFEIIIPNKTFQFISQIDHDDINKLKTFRNNLNEINVATKDLFENDLGISLILIFISLIYNIVSLPVLNRFIFISNLISSNFENLTDRDCVEIRNYLKLVKSHNFNFNFSLLINKDIIYNNIDFIKSIKFLFKFENELDNYSPADNCNICFHAYELNKELLSLHHKLNTNTGIDFEKGRVYNRDLINTKFALFDHLTSYLETLSTYNVPLLKSLDNDLENKVEKLFNPTNKNRILYIQSDSEYVNNLIKLYLTNKISPSNIIEIDFSNKTKNHKSFGNYLIVSNFSDLDISSQKEEWKNLTQKTMSSGKPVTENGFIVFIDDEMPKLKFIQDRLIGSHYWKFNEKILRNNFSRILFSMISRRLRLSNLDDRIMTPALSSLIEKNGFYFLVDGLEIVPDTLEEVIARSIESETFDINSSLCWYGLRENYIREIERPKSEYESLLKPSIVEFTFVEEKGSSKTKNKWHISGLEITEPLDNSIGIITCLCAIYNKKIHISHVKTIANYIVKDKSSIKRLKNRLSQDTDDHHNDNSTVSEHLNKIKSLYKQEKINGEVKVVMKNESERLFAEFVKDTISLQSDNVVFNSTPETKNIIYDCKINHEYFRSEYKWLFNLGLYKERLKQEMIE